MAKPTKRLALTTETVRTLSGAELDAVQGGINWRTIVDKTRDYVRQTTGFSGPPAQGHGEKK